MMQIYLILPIRFNFSQGVLWSCMFPFRLLVQIFVLAGNLTGVLIANEGGILIGLALACVAGGIRERVIFPGDF